MTCPYQFKLKYIDGLDTKQSIEAYMGSNVHYTLEYLYKELLEKKPCPSLKDLLIYYKQQWEDNWEDSIFIIRDKSKTYYYRLGQHCIKFYYNVYQPFEEKTLGIEYEVDFKLKGYRVKGYIDRLVEKDGNILEIIDYKTGRVFPTKKEFKENLQLALYQLKIQKEFPDKKIYLVWHYLQRKRTVRLFKKPKELLEAKEKFLATIKQLENTKVFPPKKSFLCAWCSFKDSCPVYTFQGIQKCSF